MNDSAGLLAEVESLLVRATRPLVRSFVRLGISPNALTIGSLVGNVAVAGLLVRDELVAAGVLLLAFNLLDLLDGEVARASGRSSEFGAFLDSFCDRYAEIVVYLGLLVWSGGRGDLLGQVLVLLALGGSTMVSYARARAEGLGLRGGPGLLTRLERIVLLGLGFLVPPLLPWVIGLMAVLTNVTAIQRAVHVWRQTAQRRA